MTGQRKALIVANDKYDQAALRDLRAPLADAEALRQVLADPEIGGFAVQVVRNESAHVIAGQLEDIFSEGRPDDVLLVHFSGHGLKSESGELFFAASNTRIDRLGSTAVAADFLQRCMRDSRSRSIVLLLDCCYSGAFAKGVRVRAGGDINVLDSFPKGKAGGGRGWAVITASGAMEFAFEGRPFADGAERTPSVFTSALVEGLATGEADRDNDGWVALGELYDYVYDKVRERTPHQTPSRQIELEGELYLARSRRRPMWSASLSADLQAALADANVYTRLGALTELRARLVSDDLPNAVAAHEVFAELARAGSRQLAEPAAQTLSAVVVRAQPTALDFGQVEQGATPPHQAIRLLGPPIARACAASASHAWIRAEQAGDGFDVSIDTASAGQGSLRGSLVLRGPTGEATVAIRVEIRERPVFRPDPDNRGRGPSRDHSEEDLGQVAGVSDRGRRPTNEDAMYFAVADTDSGPVAVAIIADGVSATPRPEHASWAAVETGITVLAEGAFRGEDPIEISRAAVKAAERAVAELAGPAGSPGTTWVSAVVSKQSITVCWVGNSRAYWLAAGSPSTPGSGGTISSLGWSRRLTRDDSVAMPKDLAGPNSAETETHSLTRWLGARRPNPMPHIEQITPAGPGVVLMCTAGLWRYQPEAAELAALALPAALHRPLDAAADLVKFVLDSGGLDNITAVLIPFPPMD